MHKFIILIITAFIIVNSNLVFADDSKINRVGRYQLFQGEYSFINIKGEQHWSRSLFKIDTVTGKMFICDQYQIDGKYEDKEGYLIQRRTCKPFEEELVIQQ